MTTVSRTNRNPSAVRPDTHAWIAAAIEFTDERGVVSVYLDERGVAAARAGRGAIERLLAEPSPTSPRLRWGRARSAARASARPGAPRRSCHPEWGRQRVDRLAAGFADHVDVLARLREWDVVVSTGSRRLMAAFARRFAGHPSELVELRPAVSRLSRRSLAEQAYHKVAALRRERTFAMVADIVEGPATIWGVEPMLDALDGGRIHHVLIADDLEASSAEQLIRRALGSGAQLTLLDAGALGPLGAAGGPRW
jgi:hypothetical protein